MKLAVFLFAAVFAQNDERTKMPLDRLDNIEEGLLDWCDAHLPENGRKDRVVQKLENLVERMVDQFDDDCAIQNPPKKEEQAVEEEMEATRNSEEDPVDSMHKYLRVLRRVNRVYLSECKRPGKNTRLADRLADKMEGAYRRAHPEE